MAAELSQKQLATSEQVQALAEIGRAAREQIGRLEGETITSLKKLKMKLKERQELQKTTNNTENVVNIQESSEIVLLSSKLAKLKEKTMKQFKDN